MKWILNNLYLSLGDSKVYYQVCKQLNILPLSTRFDLKDILFFHQIFYDLSVVSFPAYLKRFAGSRLRKCHLDNLSMVSDISPKIPQNLTSDHTRHIGISKSYFHRTYLLWNKLPYKLRAIESPIIFKIQLTKHMWRELRDYITTATSDDT